MKRLTLAVAALLTLPACLPNNEPDDPIAAQRAELAAEQANEPAKPSQTTSETPPLAAVEDPAWLDVDLDLFPVVEIDQPMAVATRAASIDLWVAQRQGLVTRVERTVSTRLVETVRIDSTPVLDITAEVSTTGENGLLNLTFSTDGRSLYVFYTDLANDIVVSAYDMTTRGQADVESRRDLIRVPRSDTTNAGGGLAIGSDGYLYIGLGDGGGSGDPDQNGQNLATALGAVLRIDPTPEGESAFLTPTGNPFPDSPGTWLYGVRSPARLSFDSVSGDLWLADIGEDQSEEINFLPASSDGGKSANLGWSIIEGDIPTTDAPAPENYQAPYITYTHDDGRCAVTGGVVYRGETMPLLNGVYIFGDFCTGEIFGLQATEDGPVLRTLAITAPANSLVGFEFNGAGELYVVGANGMISRIQPKIVEDEEG